MEKKGLSIYPLDVGTVTGFDKSLFTLRENQGLKIDVPCLAWVVTDGDRTVLVDTGPCDPAWATRYHTTAPSARPRRRRRHRPWPGSACAAAKSSL